MDAKVNDAPVYALGYFDDTAPTAWFVRREATLGNLMRTNHLSFARTWMSVLELEMWLDGLPDHAKAQIAGRQLLIFPFRYVCENAIVSTTFERVAPAEPSRELATDAKPRKRVEVPAPMFDPGRRGRATS